MFGLQMQGDIALRKVTDVDLVGAVGVPENVIAEGEHSGHAHTVVKGKLVTKNGKMYVLANEETEVKHLKNKTAPADHGALKLEPGIYEVTLQNEYDHFAKVLRRIGD